MAGSVLETLQYVAGPLQPENFRRAWHNHGSSARDGCKTQKDCWPAIQKTPRKVPLSHVAACPSDTTASPQTLRSKDLQEITRIVKSVLHTFMMPEIVSIQRQLESEPVRRWSDISCSRRYSDPTPLAWMHPRTLKTPDGKSPYPPVDWVNRMSEATLGECQMKGEDHENPSSASDADNESSPSIVCRSLKRKLLKTQDTNARNRLKELIAEAEETNVEDPHVDCPKLKTVKTGICTITKKAHYVSDAEKRAWDNPKHRRWSDMSLCRPGRVEQISKTIDARSASAQGCEVDRKLQSANETTAAAQSHLTSRDLVTLLEFIQRNDDASRVRDVNISKALSELRNDIKEIPLFTEPQVSKTMDSTAIRCDARKDTKATGFLARFKSTRLKDYERLETMMAELLRGMETLREDFHKVLVDDPKHPRQVEAEALAQASASKDDEECEVSTHSLPQDYFVKHSDATPTETVQAECSSPEDDFDRRSRPSLAEQATEELLQSLTGEIDSPRAPKHTSISVRKPRGARNMTDGRDWADSNSGSVSSRASAATQGRRQ